MKNITARDKKFFNTFFATADGIFPSSYAMALFRPYIVHSYTRDASSSTSSKKAT